MVKKPEEKISPRPINYDKFTWKEGDLTLVEAHKKSSMKPIKKDKKLK